MKAVVVVLALFFAFVAAGYPPRAPLAGSYTFEINYNGGTGSEYVGGKVYYDFVSGYYRLDTYSSKDPTPGIDGVSIWDFRENPPVVTTIDDKVQCYTQKLDPALSPQPWDFSNYNFIGFKWMNRALAEQWAESGGGVVYSDVFSRDIVGQGNVSSGFMYNILQWSDKPPSGTMFLLPNTMSCKALNTSSSVRKLAQALGVHVPQNNRGISPMGGIQCELCKKGIALIKGRVCQVAGAAACAPFPPAVPFCGVLAGVLCAAVPATDQKACQIIHLC